jgi:cytochrome c-type biogenesis protein CcmH/NrfF
VKQLVALVALLLALPTFAQGSGPIPALANQQLENPAQEAEATRVMHGLRCIQCQGQSIADSDAPMAATMRAEVRQQIANGKQPDDIREWMIQRYGEWVSFEPEMHGAGLLLWATPIVILLLGAWLARGLFRRRA